MLNKKEVSQLFSVIEKQAVSIVKHYRHRKLAKQSVDGKNKDYFVILPRNDVFS